MSSISNVGIPGVGSGIIMPKLKNRFRVLFMDKDGGSLGPTSDMLCLQVVALSEIFQSADPTEGGSVVLTVEDDINNYACSALQYLLKNPGFYIRVDHMDGNDTAIRSYKLNNCRINSIAHDKLDYAGTRNPSASIEFKTPRNIDVTKLSEEMQALIALITNTKLNFRDDRGDVMQLRKEVDIDYMNLEIV